MADDFKKCISAVKKTGQAHSLQKCRTPYDKKHQKIELGPRFARFRKGRDRFREV